MADRLYFSCQLRRFDDASLLRQFGNMLDVFPFSKLAKRGPVLRVYAIDHSEPPLIEREFPLTVEIPEVVDAAREFLRSDCTAEIDSYWDLWQYDADWKLAPAAVTLICFGPEFEQDRDDHLRIEFGPDARFLPVAGLEGSLRMGQSNLQSLLHLVSDLERVLDIESRQVWSESGANFAEVLKHAVSSYRVN